MDKADKLMIRNWTVTVARASRDLQDLAERHFKNQDLSSALSNKATELKYVCDDVEDTLARL